MSKSYSDLFKLKIIYYNETIDMKSNEKLLKLEKMLNNNIFIKETLHKMAPNEEYFSSVAVSMQYSDMFLKYLDLLKRTFNNMLDDFGLEVFTKVEMEELFLTIERDVVRNYGNLNVTKTLFEKHISSMREDFVESVSKGYMGYYLMSGVGVMKPITLNELLHLHHFATLNNERLFDRMPLITKGTDPKTSFIEEGPWQGVEYFGKETKFSNKIYEAIYNIMYNSPKFSSFKSLAHVISLNNKIIVMIRDLGHATTMEINYDDATVDIKYYIPKICNYEMAQNLPGIMHISGNDVRDYAKGSFETTKEDFIDEFNSFLYAIPMDTDIKFNTISI